jgi:hypothetical protein
MIVCLSLFSCPAVVRVKFFVMLNAFRLRGVHRCGTPLAHHAFAWLANVDEFVPVL